MLVHQSSIVKNDWKNEYVLEKLKFVALWTYLDRLLKNTALNIDGQMSIFPFVLYHVR